MAGIALLLPAQDPCVPGDWIELLKDVAALDPDDRDVAREALCKRAGPQRDALRRQAKENDHALVILALIGDGSARANVIRLTKSEDLATRRAAVEALSWAAGDSGVAELAARLDDADLRTAMAAARALARCRKKGAPDLLRRALAAKDDRKALVAAHGLELLEPGSQSSFIRQRLSHEIGHIVAANAPSVWEHYSKTFDEKTQKRDDELKKAFEACDFAGARRDAFGMLCVRSNILYPSDALAYLAWPAVKATPWAMERVPRMRKLHASCVAHEIVKLLEEKAKAKLTDEEEKHWAAVEQILQKRCAAKPPEGDFEARTKEYRAWWNRVRSTTIDGDVVRAIDDGVAWLKDLQQKDGSWRWCQCGHLYGNSPHFAGMTGLSGYTLLKMDVPVEDPAVQRAATFLLDMPIEKVTDAPTYSLSLQIMFLAEMVGKQKKPDRGKSKVESPLTPRSLKRIQECVDWLVEARVVLDTGGYEHYAWTYNKPSGVAPQPGYPPTHDHSNTQFALLGLVAAANVGVKAPLKIWQGSFNHWKAQQYAEGGWYYSPLKEGTPENQKAGSVSMTGAGLSSVLIAAASLKKIPTEKVAETEEAVARAVAKWAKAYPIPAPSHYQNPGHVFSIYYDLYSVERAMMLAGMQRLGDRDWYHDGALYILWNQRQDGAWIDASDTCFALLFLKKAYVPVASGEK